MLAFTYFPKILITIFPKTKLNGVDRLSSMLKTIRFKLRFIDPGLARATFDTFAKTGWALIVLIIGIAVGSTDSAAQNPSAIQCKTALSFSCSLKSAKCDSRESFDSLSVDFKTSEVSAGLGESLFSATAHFLRQNDGSSATMVSGRSQHQSGGNQQLIFFVVIDKGAKSFSLTFFDGQGLTMDFGGCR